MPLDDSRRLVARERDALLGRGDLAQLLVWLVTFVERVQGDPSAARALADMRRDAARVHERFASHDVETIERLSAVRADVPDDPEADSKEGGESLGGYNLPWFDAVARAPSELHETPAIAGTKDVSTTSKLIRCLRVRLDRTADLQQTVLRERLDSIAADHEHAFREYSMRLRATAGFALNRLLLVMRQLNPRPNVPFDASRIDDLYRNIIGDPEFLRSLAHGARVKPTETYAASAAEANLRSDISLVCDDLLRRLETTQSREGLLGTYKLRCEWYDVAAIEGLVRGMADELQKEDRLADHLALFLFDSGLRPLTRAMVGRLEPDLFEGFPVDPAFYVEVKQYGDRDGALKALRDGPRQIWSTAERLRSRYDLRDAFLVVFRRGGPLLRFEGPATVRELTIRPVLIDVAPGASSGGKQREIISVTVEKLLASSTD